MSVPPQYVPQQNYPPPGYPKNYPPQGYPAPAYPAQGYQQPGNAPPGVAPQGYNPYQSPQAPGAGYGYGAPAVAGGIWRAGNVLVMHKMAQLPDICVKSGQKATGRLVRNLRWFPPWIYITLFVALLLYLILATVMSQRATIAIGLSDEWFKKRKVRMAIAWGISLTGVALVGVTMLFGLGEDTSPLLGLAILLGVPMAIGGWIFGSIACRLVYPCKIDEVYIYLKGVHPSVLAMYPEWPHPF